MSTEITYINPTNMHRNRAFSQGVAVSGQATTIYIGGQNAVNAQGEIVGIGDIAAQTVTALENLEKVLQAAGSEMRHIVKWSFSMVQGQDDQQVQRAFQASMRFMAGFSNPPAISVAIVAGLANPAFLIEVEAIAVIPA